MGSHWDSTLVECAPEKISAIAEETRALLPFVFKQRLSIEVFEATDRKHIWSLECSGFRRGVLGLEAPVTGLVGDALATLPIHVQAQAKRSANFAVAVIASKVAGVARWIFYSDSLCQSAGVALREGAVESCLWADVETATDYGCAAISMTQSLLPGVKYIDDDIFTEFYGNEDRHRSIPVGV